jgi:hypothetical protein
MPKEVDRFRFDQSRVISEVLDGEFVLVHFDSGCYYSIRGTGADICRLLTAGHSVEETTFRLAEHHHLPQEQVGAEVHSFVANLVAEQLLVPCGAAIGPDLGVELSAASFSAPAIEKFDDMADQLLLDPIHEIGEAGWPVRPAA